MRCKVFSLFPLAILLLLSCTAGQEGEQEGDSNRQAAISLATQISRHSRLYTAQYIVHKIVTHNDLKRLKGKFFGIDFRQTFSIGDRKIAIPIDVTLQAYIDFSQFDEQDVEVQGDILHLTLPDPRIVVTSSKVDNKGIKTRVSLFRSDFRDEELTDFSRQGVASVVASVPQMGIIETARQNAASLLIPMLTDMGYHEENIVITFRKDFDEDDLRELYDNERSTVKIQ